MHEQLLDHVMLRLRLSDGLDLAHVAARFGAAAAAAIAAALAPHVKAGLAEVVVGSAGQAPALFDVSMPVAQHVGLADALAGFGGASSAPRTKRRSAAQHAGDRDASGIGEGLHGRVVRLTDPEGFLVSNDIISDVFVSLEPDL